MADPLYGEQAGNLPTSLPSTPVAGPGTDLSTRTQMQQTALPEAPDLKMSAWDIARTVLGRVGGMASQMGGDPSGVQKSVMMEQAWKDRQAGRSAYGYMQRLAAAAQENPDLAAQAHEQLSKFMLDNAEHIPLDVQQLGTQQLGTMKGLAAQAGLKQAMVKYANDPNADTKTREYWNLMHVFMGMNGVKPADAHTMALAVANLHPSGADLYDRNYDAKRGLMILTPKDGKSAPITYSVDPSGTMPMDPYTTENLLKSPGYERARAELAPGMTVPQIADALNQSRPGAVALHNSILNRAQQLTDVEREIGQRQKLTGPELEAYDKVQQADPTMAARIGKARPQYMEDVLKVPGLLTKMNDQVRSQEVDKATTVDLARRVGDGTLYAYTQAGERADGAPIPKAMGIKDGSLVGVNKERADTIDHLKAMSGEFQMAKYLATKVLATSGGGQNLMKFLELPIRRQIMSDAEANIFKGLMNTIAIQEARAYVRNRVTNMEVGMIAQSLPNRDNITVDAAIKMLNWHLLQNSLTTKALLGQKVPDLKAEDYQGVFGPGAYTGSPLRADGSSADDIKSSTGGIFKRTN